VSGKSFAFDFLLQAALRAIERWDRLTSEEQQRLRELGHTARGHAKSNLTKPEYKELRAIWKKLDVGRLLGEVARLRRRDRPDVAQHP
jgi:hypothetical protein